MVTWPASLPQDVLRQGYSEKLQENTIRSKNETGPAKVRRRTTANIEQLTVLMSMTTAQVATFKTFYDTTIKSGSITVEMPHPRTDVVTTFRFSSVPQITPDGVNFFVAIDLEILP